MKKMTNSYVVLRQGGMVQGVVRRASGRFRVGAKNKKEAIMFCKEQIGKTDGYTVYYREADNTLPRGMVIEAKGSGNPLVEIEGDLYIETDEYKIEESVEGNPSYDHEAFMFGCSAVERTVPVLTEYQKFVKRYARGKRDVKWVKGRKWEGTEEIADFHKYNDKKGE